MLQLHREVIVDMKEIAKNRFLVWLMWLIPIAMTGWWSVLIWTFVQIVLCDREEQRMIKERQDRAAKAKAKKEAEQRRLQHQIEVAEMFGKRYTIINGKEILVFEDD